MNLCKRKFESVVAVCQREAGKLLVVAKLTTLQTCIFEIDTAAQTTQVLYTFCPAAMSVNPRVNCASLEARTGRLYVQWAEGPSDFVQYCLGMDNKVSDVGFAQVICR